MKQRNLWLPGNSAAEPDPVYNAEQIKKARKVLPAVFGGAAGAFGIIVVAIVFPDDGRGVQSLIVLGFGITGALFGLLLSFVMARAKPKPPPARVVTDYSSEELARFREAFATAAERYARSGRRMLACFGLTAVFFFAMYYSPDRLKGWFALGFGLCFVGVLLSIKGLQRACPACRHVLGEGSLGQYCPECGRPTLKQPDLFKSPECSHCGRSMGRHRRRRNYRIHACTHCGVMLDEAGF